MCIFRALYVYHHWASGSFIKDAREPANLSKESIFFYRSDRSRECQTINANGFLFWILFILLLYFMFCFVFLLSVFNAFIVCTLVFGLMLLLICLSVFFLHSNWCSDQFFSLWFDHTKTGERIQKHQAKTLFNHQVNKPSWFRINLFVAIFCSLFLMQIG